MRAAAGNTKYVLRLHQFDMSMINDGDICVFIGKRKTGKSFLVRDAMYYKRDHPIAMAISTTEPANRFYSHHIPSMFIKDIYSDEFLDNIFLRQERMNSKIEAEFVAKGYDLHDQNNEVNRFARSDECSFDPRLMLILDDCLYDKSWVSSTTIRRLFMNGRHYFILFLLTLQYALGIPPILRTCIDFVFIMRENILANRRRIHEQFVGMIDFNMFCQVLDQCTENYGCLVVHNGAQSNKLEDQLFYYRAEAHEPFKVGAPCIWELQRKVDQESNASLYNNDEDGDDMKSATVISSSTLYRSKGPVLCVKKYRPGVRPY
jgi:hypothetical protein